MQNKLIYKIKNNNNKNNNRKLENKQFIMNLLKKIKIKY